MTQAYPLQWPAGWPRTATPQKGSYKTSLAGSINNLRTEISRLCGTEAAKTLILSSNATLGNENPKDRGVVAYVTWDGQQIAIPCDRWQSLEHNVQAIALTIEAMRAIERHGAKHMIKAMFSGFTALPAPRAWRDILGISTSANLLHAESAYKSLAKKFHPDQQHGSTAMMQELNAAIAQARKELQ